MDEPSPMCKAMMGGWQGRQPYTTCVRAGVNAINKKPIGDT